MSTLTREDLYSLERYAEVRPEFRKKVLAHKKTRQVLLGPNATLYFEDRLTMQYQIQEMLRIERIYEAAAIQEELDAYNPLISAGNELKATFMLEFPEVEERKQALANLVGVEDTIWLQVQGFAKVFAIADEDMERDTSDKTSAVHFLRFPLDTQMVTALKQGADLAAGCEHPSYRHQIDKLEPQVRDSLSQDLSV